MFEQSQEGAALRTRKQRMAFDDGHELCDRRPSEWFGVIAVPLIVHLTCTIEMAWRPDDGSISTNI